MAVGRFFFSAAQTAQNSPELHFCFISYFIQPSRVGSLYAIVIHPPWKKLRFGRLTKKVLDADNSTIACFKDFKRPDL